jgi:hypothetical protein
VNGNCPDQQGIPKRKKTVVKRLRLGQRHVPAVVQDIPKVIALGMELYEKAQGKRQSCTERKKEDKPLEG